MRLLAGSLSNLCKEFKIKNCKQEKESEWYDTWNS